ncbi:baculoviral IAP repeat-containing protein 5.1-like isoform X2 [Pseudopipra pipra]|uniref:baculoviral IAP repeat-containing protein 5.1-like isoform X2 n=1 Tax=Pseudopipra pipra TaxID=415032 RepID=UPI0031399E62
MEILLKELSSASELLTDFKEMYEYENRLKTFTKWPFQENCKCTPENMAKAGFIHCPNVNEPDVAKCFFCLLELEGWERNDDPWEEHTKRHTCDFLSLPKNFEDLTVEEYYMLEMTRLRTFIEWKRERTSKAGRQSSSPCQICDRLSGDSSTSPLLHYIQAAFHCRMKILCLKPDEQYSHYNRI